MARIMMTELEYKACGPGDPIEPEIAAEMAIYKEAARHCMFGSGFEGIPEHIWRQFATAALRLRKSRS